MKAGWEVGESSSSPASGFDLSSASWTVESPMREVTPSGKETGAADMPAPSTGLWRGGGSAFRRGLPTARLGAVDESPDCGPAAALVVVCDEEVVAETPFVFRELDRGGGGGRGGKSSSHSS